LCINPGCSDDSVGPEPEPKSTVFVAGISYRDGRNGDLRYVERVGRSWGEPEVVQYGDDVGWHSSLALDAQGNPHISYHNHTDESLMYAVRYKNGWQRSTVDDGGSVCDRCAIALDPQGNPHISYRDATNGLVKYAWNTSGVWQNETVPNSEIYGGLLPCRTDWGFPTSLAIDADGTPHICYYSSGTGNLAYITKTNDEWVVTAADDTGNLGHASSLALDAQGNPHISYLEYVSSSDIQLKYVRNVGGSWEDPEYVSVGNHKVNTCMFPTAIAVDADGLPHICYYTAPGTLGYAVKPAGIEWTVEIVDDNVDVGKYCSVVLDGRGNPHISYWDSAKDDLKCAERIYDVWAIVRVDNAHAAGMYTSIALVYR
jgi:hypothetical protein